MNFHAFDTLTRRASFTPLTAVGLATLALPLHAGAKSSAAKKARKKCQRQDGQCTDFLAPYCNGDADCFTQVQFCCAYAGRCDVRGFYTCLLL